MIKSDIKNHDIIFLLFWAIIALGIKFIENSIFLMIFILIAHALLMGILCGFFKEVFKNGD